MEHIFASASPRGALKLKLCSLNPDAPPAVSGLTLAATEVTAQDLPPPPPPRAQPAGAGGAAAMMAALMGPRPGVGGGLNGGAQGAMMAMLGGQQGSIGGASPEVTLRLPSELNPNPTMYRRRSPRP